jgi:hypothetical protein
MSRLDADIDRLYQGSLADFTAERNALAKRAGAQAAEIRGLTKPTVPAWAVNQLYWQNRPVYDRLIERADDLRATHTAALRGQRTDLRGAGRAHEESIEDALKAVLALMTANGQPVTDATRQAIATTLRSLPGDEPPGRLSRQLEPRGFEMLTAAASQGRVRPAAPAPKASRPADANKDGKKDGKKEAARIAAAREALAAAARAVRDAEHVVRREEFEAARAARDAEKAEKAVSEAEETLQQAEQALADAKRAAAAASKTRDAAQAKAAKATTQLEAAQDKEQRAQAALDSRAEDS